MAGFTFSWGSSGNIAILGKHSLRLSEDDFTFEAAFEASPATYSGSAGAHDGQFATGLATAHGYIGKNKAFTFKKGSETLLTFDPAANTGFLTHASLANAGDPYNTGRFQIRRITITGQKPASQDSRVGRREAALVISRRSDGLRSVTVSGVWTALVTPLAALASYDASIATWVATWLGSSMVLAPATGAFWVKTSETPLSLDEQNKVLSFSRSYDERKFISNPGEADNSAPKGTILSASFVELPYTTIGAMPAEVYDRGDLFHAATPFIPLSSSGAPSASKETRVPPAAGNFSGRPPSRFGFDIDVLVDITYGTPLAWFEAIGLAWVRATMASLWPLSANKLMESITVQINDANDRRARVSGVVIAPSVGGFLDYDEAVELADSDGKFYAPIMNGKRNSFDISGGPPSQGAVQTVTVTNIGGPPPSPAYLSRPWAYRAGTERHSTKFAGWFRVESGFAQRVFTHTWTRQYQRVDDVGGVVEFPQLNPFGKVKS